MKKPFLFICIALWLFIQVGCVKYKPYEPINLPLLYRDSASMSKYLPGKWQFVEDRWRGRNGEWVYHTPRTRRYDETITFTGDTMNISRTIEAPYIRQYRVERLKYFTHLDFDNTPVLGHFWFGNPQNYQCFYISINSEYLIIHHSVISDAAPDVIYKRIY